MIAQRCCHRRTRQDCIRDEDKALTWQQTRQCRPDAVDRDGQRAFDVQFQARGATCVGYNAASGQMLVNFVQPYFLEPRVFRARPRQAFGFQPVNLKGRRCAAR